MTTLELRESQRRQPRGWIVDRILKPGLCVLVAQPKVGKSRFAIDLAVSVETGALLLGDRTVERGHVLYYAFEPTEDDIVGALDAFGVASDVDIDWRRELPGDGSFEDFSADFTRSLRARPDTRVVIVDMWDAIQYPITAAKHLKDTSYKHSRAVLRPYKKLADDHKVALVLLHHTTTNTGQPNGGNAISGTADVVWTLERTPNASQGRLKVNGRSVAESQLNLGWDATIGRWTGKAESTTFSCTIKPPTLSERLPEIVGPIVGYEWVSRPELLRRVAEAATTLLPARPGQQYLERATDSYLKSHVQRRVYQMKAGKPIAYRLSQAS